MSDLVEFLRARLDEDEATARAAGPDDVEWFARDQNGNLSYGEFGWWVSGPAVETEDSEWGQAVADHIARHDPARVLREVEAKRQIIAEATYYLDTCGDDDVQVHATHTLESLAAVYSDHPDYRDEWP